MQKNTFSFKPLADLTLQLDDLPEGRGSAVADLPRAVEEVVSDAAAKLPQREFAFGLVLIWGRIERTQF